MPIIFDELEDPGNDNFDEDLELFPAATDQGDPNDFSERLFSTLNNDIQYIHDSSRLDLSPKGEQETNVTNNLTEFSMPVTPIDSNDNNFLDALPDWEGGVLDDFSSTNLEQPAVSNTNDMKLPAELPIISLSKSNEASLNSNTLAFHDVTRVTGLIQLPRPMPLTTNKRRRRKDDKPREIGNNAHGKRGNLRCQVCRSRNSKVTVLCVTMFTD
jgi:hypothetical protein